MVNYHHERTVQSVTVSDIMYVHRSSYQMKITIRKINEKSPNKTNKNRNKFRKEKKTINNNNDINNSIIIKNKNNNNNTNDDDDDENNDNNNNNNHHHHGKNNSNDILKDKHKTKGRQTNHWKKGR